MKITQTSKTPEYVKQATTTGKEPDWDKIPITPAEETSTCLHDRCSQCGGTGQRKDGLGSCVHMLSCPCPKCTPRY